MRKGVVLQCERVRDTGLSYLRVTFFFADEVKGHLSFLQQGLKFRLIRRPRHFVTIESLSFYFRHTCASFVEPVTVRNASGGLHRIDVRGIEMSNLQPGTVHGRYEELYL